MTPAGDAAARPAAPNLGAAILPVLLLVIGGACAWRGWELGFWRNHLPGAGFMPVIYGLLMVLCAVPIALAELRSAPGGERFGKPLVLAGVLLATILGFGILGGVLSLFLMMLALFVLVERLPAGPALAVSLAGAAFFHLVFVRGLSVALPTGPWGF